MKKYIKQLALSVLTLCMIFTLATGNVVNAAVNVDPNAVTDVTIHYVGLSFASLDFDDVAVNLENIKLSKEKNIRITPTFNYVSGHDYGISPPKNLAFITEEEVKTDQFGNQYRELITEQSYGDKVYQLVGWKSIPYDDYEWQNVEDYLQNPNYVFESKEDAINAGAIDFELNEYIDVDLWNEKNNELVRYQNEMTLVAIYAIKQIPYNQGEYTHKSGVSVYNSTREELQPTSEGIIPSIDYKKQEITFTIPSTYTKDEVQIILNDELVELFGLKFQTAGDDGKFPFLDKPGVNEENPPTKENFDIQPGDVKNFDIKIVNETNDVYGYVDDSLTIQTSNLKKYVLKTDKGIYTNPMPNGMKGFDGQELLEKFTPTRIPNAALNSLAKSDNSDYVYSIISKDEGENSLGALLDGIYGSGGVKNLNKYYLDFYNSQFGTEHTELEQFSNDQLKQMFTDGKEAGGSGKMVLETNVEVAETMYNYFYNVAFGVAPARELPKPGSDYSGSSYLNQKYTVGNLMREEDKEVSKDFNDFMNQGLGNITPNEKGSSVKWGFQNDGRYCFNINNNMDYGFEMGFKLEKKVGNVEVNKHIDFDGFESNDTPTFVFRLTDSHGDIYVKSMSFEEKQEDNTITFENIPYGPYKLEELDSIRYEVEDTVEVIDGVINSQVDKELVKVYYENTKSKDNDFSDTNLVINSFKKGDNGIEISKNEHNNGKRG